MVPAMTASKNRSARDPQAPTAFAETENKSLESEVTEAKALAPAPTDDEPATSPITGSHNPANDAAGGATEDPAVTADAPDTLTVTMRQHYRHNGKDLIPRRSYPLPRAVALILIDTDRATLDGEG